MSVHCHPEEGCITCGDHAAPVTVLRVDEARELALCEDEVGTRVTVETALVAPVEIGDELLVHAGTAIASTAAAGRRALRDGGLDAPLRSLA